MGNCWQSTEIVKRSILGITFCETQMLVELMRSTSHKCLIKLRQSDQKDIPGIHQKIEPTTNRTVKTKLVSFELKSQIWMQSGSAPGSCRNTDGENQEHDEHRILLTISRKLFSFFAGNFSKTFLVCYNIQQYAT